MKIREEIKDVTKVDCKGRHILVIEHFINVDSITKSSNNNYIDQDDCITNSISHFFCSHNSGKYCCDCNIGYTYREKLDENNIERRIDKKGEIKEIACTVNKYCHHDRE